MLAHLGSNPSGGVIFKMGLVNTIYSKGIKCPECGMEIDSWQSKDISNRMNGWDVGDKIILKEHGDEFIMSTDNVWTGFSSCSKFDMINKRMVGCDKYWECDIIIKKGVITEITNIRIPKY